MKSLKYILKFYVIYNGELINLDIEVIFIRHGETDYNKELRYQGHMDIDLNEKGYTQAQKVSERMSSEEIGEIYSSNLKRAQNTAELIAGPHDLKVKKRSGLREINMGDWEGSTYDDLKKEYPDLFKKWYNNPIEVRPPGGETLVEFRNRVIDSFEEIINNCEQERIVITAHGGTIRVVLAHLLDIPLNKNWRIQVHNTSVSRVKLYSEYPPAVKLVNSTYHLD